MAVKMYPQISHDGGISDFYNKTLAFHQDVLEGKKKHGVHPWPNKGHYEFLDDFVSAILDNTDGPSDINSSVISSLTISKVLESAKKHGAKIQIDLKNEIRK